MNRKGRAELATSHRPLRSMFIQRLTTTGLTVVFLTAIAGFGIVRYGSFRLACAAARGESLFVDQANQAFDDRPVGSIIDLKYTLHNLTSRPITIQGVETSCSCAVVGDLPRVIDPLGETSILTHVKAPAVAGEIIGSLSLFTDSPEHSTLQIGYRGHAVAADEIRPRSNQTDPN